MSFTSKISKKKTPSVCYRHASNLRHIKNYPDVNIDFGGSYEEGKSKISQKREICKCVRFGRNW